MSEGGAIPPHSPNFFNLQTLNKMKPYKQMSFFEQLQAQGIICNIVTMQQFIYGKSFDFDDFMGNTLDELRSLQNTLIAEYNEAVKK